MSAYWSVGRLSPGEVHLKVLKHVIHATNIAIKTTGHCFLYGKISALAR